MVRLIECECCKKSTERVIYTTARNLCYDCFMELRQEQAEDEFAENSMDWYEMGD